MKYQILGIVLGAVIGVPAVALGGSFTYSLVQGQTPAEAAATVGGQINSLFGRVETVEEQQEVTNDRLNALEERSPSIDPRLDERTKVPEPEVRLQQFSPDPETQDICDKVASFEVENKNSLKGTMQALCDRVLNREYETREQYDEVVSSLNDKWDTFFTIEESSKGNLE